ncbi:uncharacterized protein LOC106077032 isoform X1 [Biomphalaria glabrata]|uniref:Uncharacterized protein LOC106077032 isoform X1 n=2 Tax=Biomphalaria glabrata TaxID=6526 RepID=A0A9W3A1Q1_BIOGL|nr:uncharacterized protein LOC106077032 isoform X1 [Biomphalaria glabrata]XP_055881247.1 uncharacterized protein LOC106077032 isoform X1 [Biomphalaria glabrata]XP_055881248.1 uncharacterized protein LOC106077032 isoform X1 [Biomphalaria glabrata]
MLGESVSQHTDSSQSSSRVLSSQGRLGAYRSLSANDLKNPKKPTHSLHDTTLGVLKLMKRKGADDQPTTQNEQHRSTRKTTDSAPLVRNQIQGTRRVASLGSVLTMKGKLSAKHQRIALLINVKKMWRKLGVWVMIRGVLSRLQKHVMEQMTTDPSNPLYAQFTLSKKGPEVDEHNRMLFDASYYKANRQMRTTQEVRRILTLPSDQRTDDDIYCAMIGLRGIRTIAEYPIRMQQYLAKFGTIQCFEPNKVIVLQGRIPEAFYFVLSGQVLVAVQDEITGQVKVKCHLHRGHFFGELAIIQCSRRQSSVMSTCYTELLSLSSDIFKEYFMVGGIKNMNDPDHNSFLRSLPFLQGWPTDLILGQTDNTKVTFGYFKRGSVLVKDSNFSDWLIIVKSGSLTVMKKLFKIKPDLSRRRLQAKSNRSANCDILLDAVSGDNWDSLPSINQWERSRSTSSAPMSTQRASNVSNDPLIRSSSFRHAIKSSRQRDSQYSQIQVKKITKRHDVHEEAATKQSNEGDSTQGVLNTGEQITFLDFLDSAYDAKPASATTVDREPVFVVVQVLTKGSVFGLAQCLFTNQPSLSVVSNGADCILLNKKLYLKNCSSEVMRKLRIEVSPFPSDEKLQNDLLTMVNWEAYKKSVMRQIRNTHR